MKMKAMDTLHISAVGPNNIQPGQTFTVAKHVGDDLFKRGLAEKVDEPDEKAAEPPQNKMAGAPENKVTPSVIVDTKKKG